MAKEPGNLSNFGARAQERWDELIREYFGENRSDQLLARPDDRTPDAVSVDWGAFPVRVRDCLQSEPGSHRLLDWSTAQGDIGRARLQDEYLEWRVVRGPEGKILRVEMTTEFPEYWQIMAAHHPVKTLRVVARFAGEPSVPPRAVYGSVDPFGPNVTPEERKAGFTDTMLPFGGKAPWSPYNNGHKAICCMTQDANTMGGLIALLSAAAFPYAAHDPETGGTRHLRKRGRMLSSSFCASPNLRLAVYSSARSRVVSARSWCIRRSA